MLTGIIIGWKWKQKTTKNNIKNMNECRHLKLLDKTREKSIS